MGRRDKGLFRKAVSGIILTLLLIGILALAFNIKVVEAEAGTIIVPDECATIQEAINAAFSGDMIYVKAGIYEESIVINKSISLVGESRETTIIDSNGSGWAISIECSNVTIRNFTVRNAIVGIEISKTSLQARVENNVVRDCYEGIRIIRSAWIQENHLLWNNIISDNKYGIVLWGCRNVTILQNKIINNAERGIVLTGDPRQPPEKKGSHNNFIRCNNIIGNKVGIYLLGENNKFFHNNFFNNSENVHIYYIPYYQNDWDDGYPSSGNYWSDYTGVDYYSGPYQNITGNDGIGDTPYVIDENNVDHYPLMGPFLSFNTSVGYSVDVVSNSTIEDFRYFESNSTIVLQVSNMTISQTIGFCRLTIPHNLIAPPYTVKVNSTPIDYQTIYENQAEAISIIYFTYQHSTLEIIIIPEFPSTIILPVIVVLTTLATVKAKKDSEKHHPQTT